MLQIDRPSVPPHGIRCRGECRRWYPPEAVPVMFTTQRRRISLDDGHVYRPGRQRLGPMEWAPVCNSCLQKQRDARKRKGNGRARDKVRKAIERHRVTFSKWVGREITPDEMRHDYLYDLDRLVHDMEHAFENSCWWCGDLYKLMGHGLADITLDVDDPTLHREKRTVPVYGHDARFCCRTCNSKKRDLTRDQWREVCISFKRQRVYQTELELRPPEQRQRRLDFLDLIGLGEGREAVG